VARGDVCRKKDWFIASAARADALRRYNELTGFGETVMNALWHHRVSLYGPPCRMCQKPLRTPRAQWCAACGANR
jgi:hypothetical protein